MVVMSQFMELISLDEKKLKYFKLSNPDIFKRAINLEKLLAQKPAKSPGKEPPPQAVAKDAQSGQSPLHLYYQLNPTEVRQADPQTRDLSNAELQKFVQKRQQDLQYVLQMKENARIVRKQDPLT